MLEIKLRIDLLKLLVENSFSAVAERSMSDIVAQCDRLYKVDIEIKSVSYGRSNIVDVDHVLQSRADVIVRGIKEDLRLVLKASECLGIQYPSHITFKTVPDIAVIFFDDPAS